MTIGIRLGKALDVLLIRDPQLFDLPCWYAFSDLEKMLSRVRIMIMGRFSSTRARTPCFSSPDMTASQWRYEISLILRAPVFG